MIKQLHIQNVGPAQDLNFAFSPRLNLITGDNGSGKSFALDMVWWALTSTWARQMVVPNPGAAAEVSCAYTSAPEASCLVKSSYNHRESRWGTRRRTVHSGLVMYAQADGGFSIYDPMRNGPGQTGTCLFTSKEVWMGNKDCKGLISDWALWQAGNDDSFHMLKQVLSALSPSSKEQIQPGDLRKLTVFDPQRYPTLRMPHGDVAVIHAPAGMKRMISLAYLMTWAWQGHVENAKLRGVAPNHEIVILMDDVESNLSLGWQRSIVPALLRVMEALTGTQDCKTQVIMTSHSPRILATVDSLFSDQDVWFSLEEQKAVLHRSVREMGDTRSHSSLLEV